MHLTISLNSLANATALVSKLEHTLVAPNGSPLNSPESRWVIEHATSEVARRLMSELESYTEERCWRIVCLGLDTARQRTLNLLTKRNENHATGEKELDAREKADRLHLIFFQLARERLIEISDAKVIRIVAEDICREAERIAAQVAADNTIEIIKALVKREYEREHAERLERFFG